MLHQMQNGPTFLNQPNPLPFMRKEIKKVALLMIILIVAAHVFAFFISFFLSFLMAILSAMDLPIFRNAELYPLIDFFTSCIPCIVADVIVILVARSTLKIKWSHLFCKSEGNPPLTLLGIGACLGAGVIGSVIVTLYVSVLEYFQVFIPAPDLSLSSGAPIATVLLLIYGCLLGPILEEVIFRGFFLKFLQRFGSAFAIVFSAILFSLFHMNTIQLVPPFLIGLILGFVTVQSKSIVPAIIIHGVNNGMCFLMDEGFSNPEMLSFWIANSIFLVCAIGSLIVFIVLYRKKISGLFLWEKQTLPMGKGLAKAFSTPLIIVYLGIYIGTIVVPFVITNL